MNGGWTTTDYAFVISLCSAAISLFSLGWNIWSKFLYPKPRVKVQVSLVLFDDAKQRVNFFPPAYDFADRLSSEFLILPAVRIYLSNYGPTNVKLGSPIASRGHPHGPKKQGYTIFSEVVRYPSLFPLSFEETGLDKLISPSESLELFVSITKMELDELNPIQIGFFDTFGRKHLCPRGEVKHLRKVAFAYFAKQA